MVTSEISRAGAGLRKAVESGAYEEAGEWLARYSRAVTETAGQLPPGGGQGAEEVAEALKFLQWAVRAVRSGRAHTGGGLARLAAGRPYRSPANRSVSTLRLEA